MAGSHYTPMPHQQATSHDLLSSGGTSRAIYQEEDIKFDLEGNVILMFGVAEEALKWIRVEIFLLKKVWCVVNTRLKFRSSVLNGVVLWLGESGLSCPPESVYFVLQVLILLN